MTGSVAAGGFWDEELSPVWRRQDATAVLQVVKWCASWGVRFWLDEQCSLYIYVADRSARFGEREEFIGEGDRLRACSLATGVDVEVVRESVDPHGLAEVQVAMSAFALAQFRWVCRCGERGLFAANQDVAVMLHREHRDIVTNRSLE